jgi:hypothetical protein
MLVDLSTREECVESLDRLYVASPGGYLLGYTGLRDPCQLCLKEFFVGPFSLLEAKLKIK